MAGTEQAVPPTTENPVSINSLPDPADDTIEMLLNGKRFTLVTKIDCQKVPLNFGNTIAFQRLPGQAPTFFIANGDLSLPAGNLITITRFGQWRFDMDDNDAGTVWQPTVNGCVAAITTSTADIFEMNANDCRLRDAADAIDGKLSFKLRCRKT